MTLTTHPADGHTSPVAETKVRTVRVDENLWTLAALVAKRRRETVSQVIKSALVAYTEKHATDAERDQAGSR